LPPPQPFPVRRVSALTGAGCDELREAIASVADSFQIDTGEEVIAINARHAHALEQARESLTNAHSKLEDNIHYELVASDLRSVMDAFGQISGKIDHEKILDELFASFCIGK
jgi:tRNA modification GTPase